MDLVGERWTMLIVRDLVLGRLRFGELLEREPGLSRNLLAGRLKALQSAGLVSRTTGSGSARAIYQLTETGRGLEPVVLALGRWGLTNLSPKKNAHSEPELLAYHLWLAANSSLAGYRNEVHQFVVHGRAFFLSMRDGRVWARRGHDPRADVRLEGPFRLFSNALSTGQLALHQSLRDGLLVSSQNDVLVTRALEAYGVLAR